VSPLTKIFVVLHVVLSLLLTAGLVVFVNRTEQFSASLKTAQSASAAADARAQAVQNDAAASRETADAAVAAVNTRIREIQEQLTAAQGTIAERDAEVAKGSSAAALAAADTTRLTEALSASEAQKTSQAGQIAQLRSDNDRFEKNNADLNITVSDLTNKLDVANRERENFSEQLAQSKSENDNLNKLLKDNNINPNLQGGTQANLGAVPINGVISDTRTINGIPYATISVGSADNVQKGMQFNVIDRLHGQFLGQLTVDTVEPNEATGRLDGPRISDVHAGNEVRTQL
jgi:hypothetical protein